MDGQQKRYVSDEQENSVILLPEKQGSEITTTQMIDEIYEILKAGNFPTKGLASIEVEVLKQKPVEERRELYWKYLPSFGVATDRDLNRLEERAKNNQMEWKDYLCQFIMIPEILIDFCDFLPFTSDEKKTIHRMVFSQSILAHWLYYLSGVEEVLDLLKSKEGKALKPRALHSNSMLDLCVHVCEAFPKEIGRQKPAELWLTWETQEFYAGLMASGFITGKPSIQGSHTYYVEETTKWLQKLELYTDSRKCKVSPNPGEYVNAGEAIVQQAIRLANESTEFRYSSTWRRYQENYRAYLRIGKNGAREHIQPVALEGGHLLPSGRNAKRSPRKVTKSLQK